MDQELEINGNIWVIFLNYVKVDDLVKVFQGVSDSIQVEEKGMGNNV